MAKGYASDIDGDETVMDSPDVSVHIDISDVAPQEAFAIAQEAGEDELSDVQRGRLVDGKPLEAEQCDAVFHLPLGPALTALASIDAVDLPKEPPQPQEEINE